MAIQDLPHYEITAKEFASWIKAQSDQWWSVDGDSILTGRITFPCPGDELAEAVRTIGRSVLVMDNREPPQAKGEIKGAEVMDELASDLGESIQMIGEAEQPLWASDRLWDLCWKDSNQEWILIEDTEAAELARRDAALANEAS